MNMILRGSAFDKWVRQHSQSGSFKERDNVIPEQQELKELRKANAQLQMENDILKQAALIFGPTFETLYELQIELMDYVNWWNNRRPHGSLKYLSPIEFRKCWEETTNTKGVA